MNSRTLLAWALALACVSAALAFHPVHEADAFWHLSLGRAVLANHARVVPEISAFPAFSDDVVVPEWLWGIATYGLHQLGGYPLLNALVMGLAACLAPVVVLLLRRSRPGAPVACVIAVSGLVVALAHSRLRLRPQSAFLVLLPLFMMTAQAFARARPGRRRLLGAGLVGLELLWAQLHASFVLGPAIFALIAGPGLVRRWRAHARAGLPELGLFGALLAACATSAYGLAVVSAVRSHAMRAALRGSAAARPSLAWLRDHHPSERVRADARGWLTALAEGGRLADIAPIALKLMGIEQPEAMTGDNLIKE